jgi:hypothetical protein
MTLFICKEQSISRCPLLSAKPSKNLSYDVINEVLVLLLRKKSPVKRFLRGVTALTDRSTKLKRDWILNGFEIKLIMPLAIRENVDDE